MSTAFSENARFQLRQDLVVEEIDDEFLILDLTHNVYFGLNAVGRYVWRGIEQGKTLGEIVDEVEAAFDANRSIIEADVRNFLQDAVQRKLVLSSKP